MDHKNEDKRNNRKSEEFLLAEIKYFYDSFWRNEELGDRRVNFFIIITAAVIAASVAFLREDIAIPDDKAYAGLFLGLSGWLLFGLVTLARMIRRNLVTDEFKCAQNKIREYFIKNDEEIRNYLVYTGDNLKPREKERIFSFENGGLVETVGLLNSIIVAILAAILCLKFFVVNEFSFCWIYKVILCIALVIIVAVIAWFLQMNHVRQRYQSYKGECDQQIRTSLSKGN